MLRKLGSVLLAVIGLFSGSPASASPLTFYTNEAAWLAVISGFKVGTYPFDVTYTDSLVNVALFPPPAGTCCFVSTPPPFGQFAPVLGANFSSVDMTFSATGLDTCLLPVICTFVTGAVTVDFPAPIYGFASSSAFIRQEAGTITFNGQASIPPLFNGDYGGFFGVVGLINSLNFFCAGCIPTDDEDGALDLPGIVVATVDEPSGFASLATGLVLLAVASSGFRRRAGRVYRWQR